MDDLTRINGIGKATAERLAAAGIDSFEKLAHDVIAGEHGVKVEWIAEAARLHHENIQEKPPRSNDVEGTVDGAPADGGAGDPQENTQESSGTAREASSTDSGTTASSPDPDQDQDQGQAPSVGVQPGSQSNASQGDQGGGGTPAAPAGAEPEVNAGDLPLLQAAIDAWQAAGNNQPPSAIRISSRRAGFRRCNVDHPRAPTDHPVDRFGPEELERLLGEPMLTVELV